MATSVAPELGQDELDQALSAIRKKRAPDPMDDALAQIRTGGKSGDIVLPDNTTTPAPARKLGSAPRGPMVAQQDVTDITKKAEHTLGHHLPGQGESLPGAIAESAMEMVTHPVATARTLAETPARAGYALGKYARGEGSGREAAIGAAQTAAMLFTGPAEKLAEPIVARVIGEAAAPLVTRTAVGAAAGATFSPDRPAIGAVLGGAAGALSSRGVAAEKAAARQARLEELQRQHPDWLGESAPFTPEAPKRLGDGKPPRTATAKAEIPAEPSTPDYTVDEPNAPPAPPAMSPIVEKKGVFGGGLEQHGRDFADGKIAPPVPEQPAGAVPEPPALPVTAAKALEELQANPPARDPARKVRWDKTYIPEQGDKVEGIHNEEKQSGVVYRAKGGTLKVKTDTGVSVQLVDRYGQSKWYVQGDEQLAHLKAVQDAKDAKEAADHAVALKQYNEHMDALPKADVGALKPGDVLHDVSGAGGGPGIFIFDHADDRGNIFAHEPLGHQGSGFLGDARGLVATGENVSDPAVHRAVMERHHKQLMASGEASPEDLPPLETKKVAAVAAPVERRHAERPHAADLTPVERANRRQSLASERERASAYAGAEVDPAQRAQYQARHERLGKEIAEIDQANASEMDRHLQKHRTESQKQFPYEKREAAAAAAAAPKKKLGKPAVEKHEFASTQVNLPGKTAIGIKKLSASIPEADLAPDGREANPHITVKYGLHGTPIEKLKKLLANEPPVTVTLGNTSFFPNGESQSGDVLKVDVESSDLHRLNKKIADALPHTDTHPGYKPHATIAYLKAGLGKKYAGDDSLAGEELVLDHITFSAKDGKTVDIQLTGAKRAPRKLGQKKPVVPIHDSARIPNGTLRKNLETVKDDPLVSEMFKQLGAESQRDQQAAIYRTVEADVSGTQYGKSIQVATRHGNGPSEQAKALHRIELGKGVAARIEGILNARGLDDEAITRRYAEMTESAADRAAEQAGLESDRGDTSFDYTSDRGRAIEKGNGKGIDASAEKAPAGSAADAGQRAEVGPAPAETEAAAQRLATKADEVAKQRLELYEQLQKAPDKAARHNVIEQIKALERKPETIAMKGAISAEEMATRAKAGETREAVTAITGEEPTKLSTDRRQSEMFADAGEKPSRAAEQDELFSMLRGEGEMSKAADEAVEAHISRMRTDVQTIITSLKQGVPLTSLTKVYDTSGNAPDKTLRDLAQQPRTRELADRVEKVFNTIIGAIKGRYAIDIPEFGGITVSHDSLGLNLSRAGVAQKAQQFGLAYDGPQSNLILFNPYIALFEIGATGKYFTDLESLDPLAEMTFATLVHETAHQLARREDEHFTGVHTRFAGAAARVAHTALADLRGAWAIALKAGIRDDVITLSKEVWYAARKGELNEFHSHLRPEAGQGDQSGLSVGGDAAASHGRPLEGNAPEREGHRGLGGRGAAVRSSAIGSQGAGGQRAGAQRPGLGRQHEAGPVDEQAGRFNKVADDVKKAFAPASRGPLARETANLTRATVGRMAHENEVAREALRGFGKSLGKPSREEQLEFIDRMESGAPQKTEALSDAADTIRTLLDEGRDRVRGLGIGHLENYIANYFPHIWTDPEKAARLINAITGKRPMEGPRSFLKRRTIPTTKEGIELGLEPISYNPVDLALLKLREMNRYVMGQRVMRGMKDEGLAQFVNALSKAPEGYARINDHVAMVYGPPDVPVKEAFDAMVRKSLVDVIKSLDPKLLHVRTLKGFGGKTWGEADKSGTGMRTRFGGDATVIMHELGHILDFRYHVWDRLVEPVAKRPATKGKAKALGKMVADRTKNTAEAIAEREKIKKEMRALADLRMEGTDPDKVSEHHKKYLRNKKEQVANALHALMYAKAKMEKVAPTVKARLEEFLASEPKLRPLLNIEPSLALDIGTDKQSVGGLVVKGQYWAPQEAAYIINNYLSPGLRGNSVYDAYMAVGNSMNQFQLGFSAFHLGFTSMDAGVSQVALSLRQLASGRPLRALGSFVTSPAAPVTTIRRGIKLRQAYLHPDQANAELTQLVSALVQGGGRVRMDDLYKTGAIAGLRKAFHDHNPWGVAWRAFPALAELAVKPVLEYVVPRQKLGVFYGLMNLELAKLGPEPDPFQVRAVAARVWDSVDNRMGQLVYDNLFWNKTGKDLAMASVRAVGWNVGTWREIGGGLTDFATAYKRRKAGDEAFTNRMAYVIALPLFAGMMGAIYNYLATGEPPKELKDYFYPRTGKNDPDGNPERVQLPSYMKDVWAYSHHTVGTIESKLHPTIEAITEMLHNKDFYGTMIVDPDLSWKKPAEAKELVREYGKFMARAFSPFALRNALEAKRRAQSPATQGESFIGITPAPKEVVRTPAQNKMAEYLGRSVPASRTPEEADKGEAHRLVIDAVRKGEMLPESVTDMLTAHNGDRPKLSRETLFKWIGEAKEPSTVTRFKKLSFEEAQKVWELANDDERAQWANAYRTKVVNAR